PRGHRKPVAHRVESQGGVAFNFLACPSTSQCTLINGAGEEITFNPIAPGAPTPVGLHDTVAGIQAFACASTTECTAVDDLGAEITFNPQAPGTPKRVVVAGTLPLQAIACATSSECVATSSSLGNGNVAVVFNPASGTTTRLQPLSTRAGVVTVTCPSISQCTAVDFFGT